MSQLQAFKQRLHHELSLRLTNIDHDLIRQAVDTTLIQLSREFRANTLYLSDKPDITARNQSIKQRFAQRDSVAAIARDFGLSERSVWRIVKND